MWVKSKHHAWMMIAAACLLLEGWALHVTGSSAARWRPALAVQDEPAAHALYDAMIEAMRRARSLSYTGVCGGPDGRTSTHRVRLKKPDLFHVEVTNDPSARRTTLVGDGSNLWVHWSADRPFLRVDDEQSHERAKTNVYIREAFRAERDSIQSKSDWLGVAWFGTILDPSIFCGYTGPLEPCMDGVRSRGTNQVGDEDCDVIEVSYLRAQRTRYFWLSRQDHLPRKIKEVLRVADNEVTVEEWSDVTVNGELPAGMFTWSPPDKWTSWDPPAPEDYLPKRGQEAPDFELLSARTSRIRLSDFRGTVVWFYMWATGSPLCREQMQHLQQYHREHGDKGLTILGFNHADNQRIARAFLREHSITFATILDASHTAERVMCEDYGNRLKEAPLSCVIDRQGNLVDAWRGPDPNHTRALAALKEAGLDVKPILP